MLPITGSVGGGGIIPTMPMSGAFRNWVWEKDGLRADLRSGRFRFGVLDRIALADGSDIELWSARDAPVLQWKATSGGGRGGKGRHQGEQPSGGRVDATAPAARI